jgi:hypothetical protein
MVLIFAILMAFATVCLVIYGVHKHFEVRVCYCATSALSCRARCPGARVPVCPLCHVHPVDLHSFPACLLRHSPFWRISCHPQCCNECCVSERRTSHNALVGCKFSPPPSPSPCRLGSRRGRCAL